MTTAVEVKRPLPRPLDAGGRRGRAPGPDALRPRGRGRRRARPERLGQDDAAADPRPGSTGPRPGACASSAPTSRRLSPARARRVPHAHARLRRPALRARARPELTARELVALPLGLRGASAAERARARRRAARARRARATSAARARPSSPAASSSASPSAPRSRTGRGSSSPTSRRASSTRRTRSSSTALIGELAREAGLHDRHRQPRPGVGGDRRPDRPRSATAASAARASRQAARGGRSSSAAAAGSGCPRSCCAAPGSARTRPRASADGGIVVSAPADSRRDDARAEQPRRSARDAARAPSRELRGVRRRSGRRTARLRRARRGVRGRRALRAVTGPSGSGKTTLLHLLAGLELPGRRRGRRPRHARSRARPRPGAPRFRREHVALVGQEPGLVPFLTAPRERRARRSRCAASPRRAGERAPRALDAVGLAERAGAARRAPLGGRARARCDRPRARGEAGAAARRRADVPPRRGERARGRDACFAALAREHGAAVVCATHDPLRDRAGRRRAALRPRVPAVPSRFASGSASPTPLRLPGDGDEDGRRRARGADPRRGRDGGCRARLGSGSRPSSSATTRRPQIYIGKKHEAAREAGIEPHDHHLPADTSEADLLALVAELNARRRRSTASSSSCRCPATSTRAACCARSTPIKDVDGFHPASAGPALPRRADVRARRRRSGSWRCSRSTTSRSRARAPS